MFPFLKALHLFNFVTQTKSSINYKVHYHLTGEVHTKCKKLLLLCAAMANLKRFEGDCVVLCWFYQGKWRKIS